MRKIKLPLSAWVTIIAVCLGVLVYVVCSCSLFSDGPPRYRGSRPGGACNSVVWFGKLEIEGVDKVVISSDTKSVTITEQELVDQIVEETEVADYGFSVGCGCCEIKDRRIELYSGDRLIRSMDWFEDNIVKVYETDLTHWVFFVRDDGFVHRGEYAGYVRLSQELEDQLDALFNDFSR